jgi:hypothetical protein
MYKVVVCQERKRNLSEFDFAEVSRVNDLENSAGSWEKSANESLRIEGHYNYPDFKLFLIFESFLENKPGPHSFHEEEISFTSDLYKTLQLKRGKKCQVRIAVTPENGIPDER